MKTSTLILIILIAWIIAIIGILRGHMGNVDMAETAYYLVRKDGTIISLSNTGGTCTDSGKVLGTGETCEITSTDTNSTDCSNGDSIKIVIANGRSVSNNIAGCKA